MKKNNFKSLMQAAVLVCTPLVIASCDDVFGDVDNPVSSHISIKDAAVNLVLHADSTAKATYTRTAIAASGAQIEYSSSNEKIATVDAKTGKITAVGNGTCNIIAKATGLDSRGNKTYQEEEVSFPVTVTDYRARVDKIEGAEIPVYNSADANLTQLDMSKIVKAWPAKVALTYVIVDQPAAPNKVVDDSDLSKIVLTGNSGTAKVKATIAAALDLGKYERKSFPENQETAELEITVKEGVAYISGYDATGKAIRKTMFKDYNDESYTDLSDKLMNAGKTAFLGTDVTLDAGWYYVDRNLSSFANNIRVKGDVNFILNDTWALNLTKDLMDESAKQNYKLNFYSQRKNGATPEIGTASFANIKEFKEVNICGAKVSAPVNAVVNVTVNNGTIGNLTGTGAGAVDITNATATAPAYGVGQVSKFATVAINKGTAASRVTGMDHITTATIAEGAIVGASNDITTLTIDKAASIGNLTTIENLTINKAVAIGNLTTIGTADITETPTNGLQDIEALTLNKVDATATTQLLRIGTATINKLVGTAKFTGGIKANALNISDIKCLCGNFNDARLKAGT